MRSTHDDLRGQSILIQVLTSKMLCRRWQRGRACMWISGSRRISSNWQRRSPCGLARYEVSRERLFQGNADLSRAAPPNSDFAYSNARYREIEACWHAKRGWNVDAYTMTCLIANTCFECTIPTIEVDHGFPPHTPATE